MKPKPISIKTKRIVSSQAQAPAQAHKFTYARVGPDIVLEVGHFDLVELSAAIQLAQKGQDAQTSLHVTHQFALSPQGAMSLLETAQQMVQDLKNSGMIKFQSGVPEGLIPFSSEPGSD
ncbi:MAG: hypothetical protein KDC35_07575 [Acidobacteria bacterium]|nr:hypothetical protein [Acidobacteriota bacterium]